MIWLSCCHALTVRSARLASALLAGVATTFASPVVRISVETTAIGTPLPATAAELFETTPASSDAPVRDALIERAQAMLARNRPERLLPLVIARLAGGDRLPVFAIAARDERAEELAVLVVNASHESIAAKLELIGARLLANEGRVVVATPSTAAESAGPPASAAFPLSGPTIDHMFPAESATMLRIPVDTPVGPDANPYPAEEHARLDHMGRREVRVHDPSTILREGPAHWMFGTGFGVSTYRSTDLREWERGPRAFTELPAWHRELVPDNRGHLWAPDIIRHSDGRYLLYYSVSSWGKNTSAIGLASSPTLDWHDPQYGWTDHGVVVRSVGTDKFNAIDPAIFHDQDGRLWMTFGSFWDGIMMIELDPGTGLRIAPDSPIHPLAHHDAIEAPFLYRRGQDYYLFVNWGSCCRGIDSTYEIRVGRSRDVTGPYVDRDGVPLLTKGGSLLLSRDGAFIGPGHASVLEMGGREWLSLHFYDGTQRGRMRLALRPLEWTEDGWPVVR
jgi:arabinan endo-1,5-alpha-L-arabinosidase